MVTTTNTAVTWVEAVVIPMMLRMIELWGARQPRPACEPCPTTCSRWRRLVVATRFTVMMRMIELWCAREPRPACEPGPTTCSQWRRLQHGTPPTPPPHSAGSTARPPSLSFRPQSPHCVQSFLCAWCRQAHAQMYSHTGQTQADS